MAKKFVRGITDIKTINNQDFDTNNVNDLLSDGKHNYIHRKKSDGTEEYHNLTNNLKTLQSDDTDLLTVTNYNNTTNSATIRPKHDSQKEQVLESTNETILISHGKNGTEETTNVDVNFDKVQAKLTTGNGLAIVNNQIIIRPKFDSRPRDNGLFMSNIPNDTENSTLVSLQCDEHKYVQIALKESSTHAMLMRYRFVVNDVASEWKLASVDHDELQSLLSQKQNTLTSNTSIGVDGTGLMQLYSYEMGYSNPMEGALNTYAKTVKKATQLTADPKLEYHFTAQLKDGIAGMTVELEDDDVTYFTSILDSYGETSASGKRAMINGLLFTLNGSQLTVSRDVSSTAYNQVVSFSDIIEPPQNVE